MRSMPRVSPPPGNDGTRRRAAWRAAGCAAALLAGWTATVTPDGAKWLGVRGPRCLLGECLGPLACPGCGLLRSTAAALQGDFAFAWRAHPAGVAVAALLLGSTALHFDMFRRGTECPAHRRWQQLGYRSFVLTLLAGYSLRLLLHSAS